MNEKCSERKRAKGVGRWGGPGFRMAVGRVPHLSVGCTLPGALYFPSHCLQRGIGLYHHHQTHFIRYLIVYVAENKCTPVYALVYTDKYIL